MHNAWKRDQDAVCWVDINLGIRKGLTFFQSRSNAIILQWTLPAYCIPKVVRLKTEEILYERPYMSPRPPPKISLRHDLDWTRPRPPPMISLRHDWTKELVSKVDRQPQEEVSRQAKFFQPTQPIPKPICDRSGKNLITRKVCLLLQVKLPVPMRSRRNLLTKNSVLQIDQGNLISLPAWLEVRQICLEKSELSKLTIDQGNLINMKSHYEQPLKYIVRSRRSTPTMSWFVKDLRKTWTSNFQDCHIPLWSNCRVPAFENWFRRSRTTEPTCSSTRPTTESIIKSLPSRIKTNDSWSWEHRIVWITRHGTQNAVQSMFIILGHWHRLLHVRAFLAKRNGGEKEICQVHSRSPLDSQLLHKERATPRAPLRDEARGPRVLHREFVQEEMQKRSSTWVFTTGSYDTRSSARTWLTTVEHLADEDHTHHLTPEEIDDYRTDWCIRSNKIGSDTMPIRHRFWLQTSIVYFATVKRQRRWSSTQPKMDAKLFFVCGTGKDHGILLTRSTTKTYPAPIDQGNLIMKWLGHLFEARFSEFTCFVAVGSFTADVGQL